LKDGTEIRKGAFDAIRKIALSAGNPFPKETEDIYFWGRPSCAGDGYDATSSAGSNKGPTNAEYLAEVEARIDTFLKHHPYLSRKEVPAEMVTASGSGLDPDITPACAYVQVQRVAKARGMSEETVKAIVDKAVKNTQKTKVSLNDFIKFFIVVYLLKE
jgi:potassium-transporting ATPase KdpC subunit